MRYDCIILGTGPAGISAAITLKIRNKNILLIGSKDLSKKLAQAAEINNYPGFPKVKGSDLAKALKAHLDSLNIEICEEKITAIYSMGSYFLLQGNTSYEATSVILAAGVVNEVSLPGEDEMLGCGVSYCATCDAMLYRNKDVIVIGYNKEAINETNFLAEVCHKVIFIPMKMDNVIFDKDNIEIKNVKPIKLINKLKEKIVVTDNNEEIISDGIFILRDAIAPKTLVPGLETDGAHVKCDHDLKTNIPGLFVAGDIAGMPYQYIKAAGEGNVAALSVVKYLNDNK